MRSIDVIDSIEIHAPPSTVFATVLDYANIHFWFPSYHCKLIDSDNVFEGCSIKHRYTLGNAISLSQFTRRIDRIENNHMLEESYIAGDLLGTGVWRFLAQDNNPDKTLASYHCKVRANTHLVNLGFMLCGAKGHSLVYRRLLKNLKAHCEQIDHGK